MTAPMIQIDRVSKRFKRVGGVFSGTQAEVVALDQISFSIEPGESLAVVGGSGSGKSTLAKILVGLVTPDSGSAMWEGRDLLAMPPRERARLIQMIFQDPYASLNPKLTVGAQLRDVGPGREIEHLESVGLAADALNHYPFQFSGGQRQRIAIARAIALEPRLLIADEPLSALDVTIQAQILELFRALKSRLGLTMLLITHDLALAAGFADRVIVLDEGKLIETGAARETLAHPQHAVTQALAAAAPVMAL